MVVGGGAPHGWGRSPHYWGQSPQFDLLFTTGILDRRYVDRKMNGGSGTETGVGVEPGDGVVCVVELCDGLGYLGVGDHCR